ncbi:MAG: DNA mismatch repair protein MutS, partial [Pseudomonadota bacterium]|nr:DNA mismatch repair protein MutS [Pseudomonadota bacterium]
LLAMLAPAELVVPVGAALPDGAAALGTCLTEQAPSLFDSVAGNRALCAYYGVASLDGFGQFSRAMTGAAGALLGYIELTQKGNMPRLRPPAAIAETGYMEIDQATRRSLEITRTLGGEMRGSLLAAIDLTVTAAGGRLLAARISAPLAERQAIMRRLELVGWYHDRPDLCGELRDMMKGQP